jgi:hypothetical protein
MSEQADHQLSRRKFLAAGGAIAAAGAASAWAAPAARAGRVVPLPSPARVRADYQRMVDFGPRLPGYVEHHRFCDWLEEQFVAAGLQLIPCDNYDYERWRPERAALAVLDGASPGPVKVATSFVRSKGTPAAGVVGPLVHDGSGGAANGSVLLVDLDVSGDLWIGPWPNLQQFADRGAKAVVFVVDKSFDELAGNWSPHTGPFQPIPALVVDRDAGRSLRERAGARPNVRLTLQAPVKSTLVRSITAILPGKSDEAVVVDTHTDGQNFVEENGAVALVHLARHYASLPASRRLNRTLVLAAWPGHMAGTLPQAPGWVAAHPDIVKRSVAAVTIEHLGATEWIDTPGRGYHGTGKNHTYVLSTTTGRTTQVVRKALAKARLDRHVVIPAPGVSVGSVFHEVGVPHVGGIAGPSYLLVVSKNGEMDKLDAKLAARQTGFYADVIRHLDRADAAELQRTADATLGSAPLPRNDESRPVQCGPEDRFIVDAGKGRRLAVRLHRLAQGDRSVTVTLTAMDEPVSGVTVELRRGKTIHARSGHLRAGRTLSRIVLRRPGDARFPRGAYSLIVRGRGKVLERRIVRVR